MLFESISDSYVYLAWLLTGCAVAQLLFLTLRRLAFVFDLFAHYTLIVWIVVMINLVMVALFREWVLIIGNSVALAGLSLYVAEYFYRAPITPTTNRNPLKIMAYNVQYSNTRQSDTIEYVLNVQPDVVVLFEVTENWNWYLMRLSATYPHSLSELNTEERAGVAIYSKLPFKGDVHWIHNVPYLDVALAGAVKPLRLIGLHLLNPTRILNRHWGKGLEQVEQVMSGIDAKMPTVLLGDLNSTPNGAAFRRIVRGGEFVPAGRGRILQPTWGPWGLPLLQIDHVFVTRSVRVIADAIGPNNGSDHRPIMTAVDW